MNLKQFKNLIENSTESTIALSEDITYEKIFDDFCENESEISISIERDLVIDGNGHAIDMKEKNCEIKLGKCSITFRDIHFKDHEKIEFIGNDSLISIVNCRFTDSYLSNWKNRMNIEDSTFQNDSKIESLGPIRLKNIHYENNYNPDIFVDYMIKVEEVLIENCNFENNDNVITIRGNGQIIDSAFKNNRSPIRFAGYSLSIENTLFDGNKIMSKFRDCIFSSESKLTLKNCIFKNNSALKSRIINSEGKGEVNIYDCIFEDNLTKTFSQITKKKGLLTLKNCTFKGENSKTIFCKGKLNLIDCKFKKHHKINGRNVFEISKRESEFLKAIK